MSDTNAIRAEEGLIRIMSSNILAAITDEEFLLPKRIRAKSLCAHYLAYSPDLIGLQEIQTDTIPVYIEQLSDVYTMVDVDTKGLKNWTPLFYKTAVFDLLQSKFVSFFDGGMWHYEWALYRRKSDDKRVIHMNLHYHFSTSGERIREAELVNTEIRRLEGLYPDAAVFVTGDYNCESFTSEFKAMIDGLDMNSGMYLTDDNDGYETGWHHPDTCNYEGEGAIDHICVSYKKAKVVRHRKLKSELLRFSTDHDPVFIDVLLV